MKTSMNLPVRSGLSRGRENRAEEALDLDGALSELDRLIKRSAPRQDVGGAYALVEEGPQRLAEGNAISLREGDIVAEVGAAPGRRLVAMTPEGLDRWLAHAGELAETGATGRRMVVPLLRRFEEPARNMEVRRVARCALEGLEPIPLRRRPGG